MTEPAQRRAGKCRMTPSCTTVAINCPSLAKNRPVARPREPAATGDSVAYSAHWSKRNGRWNQIEWLTVAATMHRPAHDRH